VQGPASGLTNVTVTRVTLTGPKPVPVSRQPAYTLYREVLLTVTGTAS